MQFEGIYGLKTELKYPFKDWGGGGGLWAGAIEATKWGRVW